MSQFFRLLLLVLIFLFLYRLLKRFLQQFFSSSGSNGSFKGYSRRQKKYDNIEEAKYTEIRDEEEKKNK